MHLVEIHKIEYHPESKGYILILKKTEGDSKIPILIGSNEAQSLSLAYEDIRLPRPSSHDLLLNLIQNLDAELMYIVISKYEKGTFFANIVIKKSTIKIDIDSRPSDAISIALKALVPIYVSDNILKIREYKTLIKKQHFSEQIKISKNNYNEKDIMNNLMKAMDKAVKEENYEVAVKLRDRIISTEKKTEIPLDELSKEKLEELWDSEK